MENIEKKNEPISAGNLPKISNDTPSSVDNLCIVCKTSKREVVFVPCGHYLACVPCGHGMETCSICSSKITAYVRIYE